MKPLLPQRDPIVMVDDVQYIDHEHATTSLLLTADKYVQGEAALVEHAAQSCAALMGCRSGAADLGYIGEVKKFRIGRLPQPGETLRTALSVLAELGGITLVECTTTIGEETVAEGQLKLFIHE